MKNLLLFFLFITLIACNKDEVVIYKPSGDIQYGSFSALKNGNPFEAGGYAFFNQYLPNNLCSDFRTINKDSFLREIITVSVPWKLGKYTMATENFSIDNPEKATPYCSYFTRASDGDVAEYAYKINPDKKSILNVTKLDTANNNIEGTFDLYFIREGEENPEKPIKVAFRNGKFKMQYRK